MIHADTLSFLSDLKENNHREWFHENKKRYNFAKKNVIDMVGEVIDGISEFDDSILNQEPKKCLFRINRDIRFSKNKAPYKLHFGASISKGGRQASIAGYYIHIEPNNHFIGGGIWHPDSPSLRKIRAHIDLEHEELEGVLATQSFQKVYGTTLHGGSLKTAPKGYARDHPAIVLLRMKDFVVTNQVEDKVVQSDNFVEYIVKAFKTLHPFISFFNDALE